MEKEFESKFETKNPLKRQHIVTVHINYYAKNREQRVIHLYKHSLGEYALTARGTVLADWLLSDTLKGKMKRLINGIKSVQLGKLNVSVKEYYNLLFGELHTVLENDKYWRRKSAEYTTNLWKRVSKVLNEVADEDIEIEVPELVTYFYNFYAPRKVSNIDIAVD